MIYCIESLTGRIVQRIHAPNDHAEHYGGSSVHVLVSDEVVEPGACYVIDGQFVPFPEKPSHHHEWDWSTKSWLPNLDAAKAAKKAEVEAELARRLYLPYNGFDADPLSRERISGTIARLQRGDPLPAGWVGWRDFSNQQQWAADDAVTVLANLTALSRAIEDREQALLIAAWTHKAAIASLADIDAALAYPITAGWPA